MDKARTIFVVKAFQLQLPIMPGFSVLKKAIRDMQISVPQGIKDELKINELADSAKAYAEKNTFADAQHAFDLWADEALKKIELIDDSKFESRRGRDVENQIVELFGKKQSVPQHAVDLLKGSKLADMMLKGPGDNFGSWTDLKTVLNLLRNKVADMVPADQKTKRPRKGAEVAA